VNNLFISNPSNNVFIYFVRRLLSTTLAVIELPHPTERRRAAIEPPGPNIFLQRPAIAREAAQPIAGSGRRRYHRIDSQ